MSSCRPNFPTKVVEGGRLPEVNKGRVQAITIGPDEMISISTSNNDGRGKKDPKGDKIWRIVGQPMTTTQ